MSPCGTHAPTLTRVRLRLPAHDEAVSVAFTRSSPTRLVVGTLRGGLYVLDVATHRALRRAQLPHLPDFATRFGALSRSTTLIVATNRAAMLFDTQTGAIVRAPGPQLGPAALAPDGRVAVGVGPGHELVVWDPLTGQRFGRASVALPPDSGVSAGDELLAIGRGESALFEVATMRQVGRLAAPSEAVSFSPSRPEMIVRSQVVPFDPRSLSRLACEVAGRSITTAEWSQYVGAAHEYSATCPEP
jgi:hypothetical protein